MTVPTLTIRTIRPRTMRPQTNRPLDDLSPGRFVPWSMRLLEDGQSIPDYFHQMDRFKNEYF
jgi:hypothetical protein